MRKFILTLMASLLSCSAVSAFWPEATDSSLEVGVGYRRDHLKWKTHVDTFGSSYSSDESGSVPFGLSSDLKWKNLQIWQIEGRGKYVTCDNIYLRASGDYGWIYHGKNTDSDHVRFESGSPIEFSRSHARTRGHVYDADVAVGYQFKMCDDSLSITPLVGYSWKGQHLRDRHLRIDSVSDGSYSDDIVFAAAPNEARSSYYSYSDYSYDYSSYSDYSYSYSGRLHSKYHTRWNGPFIGFDLDYRLMCDWTLFLDYEFHWACYHAKARWNLRPDLPDGFHHRARNAYGHVVDFGVKWDFCDCWTLALKGKWQYFEARRGRDRALIVDDSFGDVKTKCYVSIPLRKIEWCSGSVSVDLGMVF
ncbi:hypothetical protein [Candidatus Protochlamydia phocaeensis]|uniref:hypothetical protein n=1 Tax=Candidatus Protochlamydia phocaeensis TaxID=1414722 RepID=UPI0008385AEE|nr:hypothetical protein [Candidatus Protochlamydia phocaeensis]